MRICIPDNANNTEHKRTMGVLRARHETLNGSLTNWGCLWQFYCHSRNKHCMLFQTVAVVAQVNISLGNPLFQVKKTMIVPFFLEHRI